MIGLEKIKDIVIILVIIIKIFFSYCILCGICRWALQVILELLKILFKNLFEEKTVKRVSFFVFLKDTYGLSLNGLDQVSAPSGIWCLIILGGSDVIILEIKGKINVMPLTHSETTPPPQSWSME